MNPGTEQKRDGRDAVVLLSGGLDSATVLAMAGAQGYRCHALSIAYGQRHSAELDAARALAEALGCASFRQVDMDMRLIGGSALTDHALAVPTSPSLDIPITYVPARNTVFLSLAMGLAEVLGAGDIFIGVNAVDYSGYPDCRPAFIAAFQALANVATKVGVSGGSITIETPLMALTKSQIINQGVAHGVDYALTVSCYQADDEGRACGVCDSCRLRAQGFADAGVEDVTRYFSGA